MRIFLESFRIVGNGVGRRCATGLCWCVVVMGEEVGKEGWSGRAVGAGVGVGLLGI